MLRVFYRATNRAIGPVIRGIYRSFDAFCISGNPLGWSRKPLYIRELRDCFQSPEKYREQGSNLHILRYLILNQARLPIPPSRHVDGCRLPVEAEAARILPCGVPVDFHHLKTAAELSRMGQGLELAQEFRVCLPFLAKQPLACDLGEP